MNRLLPAPAALLAALVSLAVPSGAAAQEAAGRIIVKWRDAASSFQAAPDVTVRALSQRLDRPLARGRDIGGGMSVVHLEEPQRGEQLARTLAALRADPLVEIAEPDRRVKPQAYTPSDPLFPGNQWYLRGFQLAGIRADTAWETARGGASPDSSVIVAVLDTGVRLDHPDLAGKLLPGFDFVSSTAISNDGDGWDPDPSDPGDYLTATELASDDFRNKHCGAGANADLPVRSSWHGTRVAGLIGANTDNGVGIAGAGFNARVLPVRVLGKCGGFESDVMAGMYWAAGLVPPPPLLWDTNLALNANPAQVINLSLGSSGPCTETYRLVVRDITAAGVLIVVSAGNEGGAVTSPANCPGVLAVAGLRHAGTKVGYSNLGPEVGIAAPAGNCVSTLASDPCQFALNTTTNLGGQSPGANGYSSPLEQPTYGTSFSSPLAAATAALMKSVNPALTPVHLIARIRQTARSFPAGGDGTLPTPPPACVSPSVTPLQDYPCICNTGVCGAGMLNAAAAVLAAQRPAAIAAVNGMVRPGNTLTLDGSHSAAATGRSIVSWSWTVDSASGGATAPTIGSADQPIATIASPVRGGLTLRLTVTDNLGASDFATVTVEASGDTGSSAPPPQAPSYGGGGFDGWLLLMLVALLLGARLSRPA